MLVASRRDTENAELALLMGPGAEQRLTNKVMGEDETRPGKTSVDSGLDC